MDDSQGGGRRRVAAEELILRTIAAHADSLLRTARRHSMCLDDAQDAYQRAIEIFMSHAPRLDPVRAPGWLHVVVKREAQAIRQARRRLLSSTEIDLDGRESDSLPSPDEQLLRFDVISRSAEALKRLKPHELRALWLRAQGHSYSDIAAITGWSYTKVNRCLSEGRRNFIEHYEGIESGEECRRWLPVLSALVDGEASSEQLAELRPHLRNCPGCRATLRALQDSRTPLAALLPGPLLIADGGIGDHVAHAAMRLYEIVSGGLHERAVHSLTKAQALVEASAAGKVTAVAASAAAVAGGGYASVEQIVQRPVPARHASAPAHHRASRPPAKAPTWSAPTGRQVAVKATVTTASTSASALSTAKGNALRATRSAPRMSWAAGLSAARPDRPRGAQHVYGAQVAARPARASLTSAAKAAPAFATRGSAPGFSP
jgi:RNA polymerase sigma factor (sigma-70 family)